MKIGVLSDTHLKRFPAHLIETIEHHFKDADMILHAGDVVESNILDYFADKDVRAVAGNMDSWQLKECNPLKMVIPIEGFKVGLIHGWGSPVAIEERIRREFDSIDVLVYGHTHNPSSHIRDGVLFFNPGSPTCKRFAAHNTIGILEVGENITPHIITIE
jgi:putative phosphoesterase